jgi:hypothetical protein
MTGVDSKSSVVYNHRPPIHGSAEPALGRKYVRDKYSESGHGVVGYHRLARRYKPTEPIEPASGESYRKQQREYGTSQPVMDERLEINGRHEDLKPKNILIEDGISDFGLGKFHRLGSRSGMNPESGISTDSRNIVNTDLVIDNSTTRRSSGTWSIDSIPDSIFSQMDPETSHSSMSSQNTSQAMIERLVGLFLEDHLFKELCLRGLGQVARDRFERNLRRLLMIFAGELRLEAKSEDEQNAARFVKHRATNSAHMICNSLTDPTRKEKEKVQDQIEFQEESDGTDDESDSDRSEGAVDSLLHLEEFIKSSTSLINLKAALEAFVQNAIDKETSHGPQLITNLISELGDAAVDPGVDLLKQEKCVATPVEQHQTYRIVEKCRAALERLGMRRPKVQLGKTRIEWQCVSNNPMPCTVEPAYNKMLQNRKTWL